MDLTSPRCLPIHTEPSQRPPLPHYFQGELDRGTTEILAASQAQEIFRLVERALPKPLADCDVLDVGCGAGNLALAMAKHARSVVGVEANETLVRRAHDRAQQTPVANAKFLQRDLFALGEVAKYDLIVCSTVLEHVPNGHRALTQIVRAMRPWGVLYLTVPNKLWPIECHYGLPFLSWLPLRMANWYVRVFRKATSYEDACYAPTYFQLRQLLRQFPLRVEFRTPVNIAAEVYGMGHASYKWLYRLGKALIDRCPWFWIISKGFIVVAVKNDMDTGDSR